MAQLRADVLRAISPYVEKLTAKHENALRVSLWSPSRLLESLLVNTSNPLSNFGSRETTIALAKDIPPQHKAALVLNLLTEEDLPHFLSLLSTHIEDDPAWSRWFNIWTSEEERHGTALYTYAAATNLVRMDVLDEMKRLYIREGFAPKWGKDPYKLLAYVSLQEYATQISHLNLSRELKGSEPLLSRILGAIAKEEARHYAFYRDVFAQVIELDPSEAIKAFAAVVWPFDMPGVSIPNYRELSEVESRSGIFTPFNYSTIVEQLIKFWRLDRFSLSGEAQNMLDTIKKLPERLDRVGEHLARSIASGKRKTFSFPFLSESFVL